MSEQNWFKKKVLLNPVESILNMSLVPYVVLILLLGSTCKRTETVYNYENEGAYLLNNILDSIRMDYKYIAQPAHNYNLVSDTSLIFKDKVFTEEDLKTMRDQIANNSNYEWNSKVIKNIKMIPTDTLNYYFNDNTRDGWKNFHKRYGSGFISCSFPIFDKERNMCIVQLGLYCGPLCGGGEIVLFQKRNKKWILAKIYSDWTS